jgi:hypothetical protein
VQIVCDHCKSNYEIDLPPAPYAQDQDLMFRCAACQRSFPIRFTEPSVAPPPEEEEEELPGRPTPPPADAEASGLLLRQEGSVYHVRDLAMLQRWVAERRVLIGDEISEGDGRWIAVADMDELSVFFDLVAAADRAVELPQSEGDAMDETADWEETEILTESPTSEPFSAPVDTPIELTSPADTAVDEAEIALDGIPEEDDYPGPAALGPDDPTMDLGEDTGAFFTDDQPMPVDEDLFGAVTEEYILDDDPDFEWAGHKRRQKAVWWFMLFIIGGAVGYGVLRWLEQQDAGTALKRELVTIEPAEVIAPAAAPVEDVVAAAVDAMAEDDGDEPDDEPEEIAEDIAEDEPDEAPPPAAAPQAPPETEAAPPAVNARTELDAGWAAVDRGSWASARRHFQAALSASPGHPDGRFGMAYVTEHQGNVDQAVSMYCRLVSSAGGEVRTEAEGRLRALRRTCP